MATTTNYGWETPDDTDLVKDGAAAIRTLGNSVDTTTKNLNPETTLGDIAYRSATSNTNTRLAIGSAGQVLTVASGVPSWAAAAAGGINPNLVINGNFAINQRSYVSAANLASGSYGFDRWKSNFTNTTLTFTAAPAGQTITINSGGGLQQIVEQGNVPAGSYVLSFTGTATGRIYNSGGTAPSYAASPITFTADGTANVVVEFTASGATKTLGKVKLELGSAATNYSYVADTLQGELAACQRYYYLHAAGTPKPIAVGYMPNNTSQLQVNVKFPVNMRTEPSLVAVTGTNYYSFLRRGVVDDFNSFTLDIVTNTNANIYNASEISGNVGDVGTTYIANASGSVAFSAEL